MSTLFVIGNRFDRAHVLKTSYWDFRKYLEKYAEDLLSSVLLPHAVNAVIARAADIVIAKNFLSFIFITSFHSFLNKYTIVF